MLPGNPSVYPEFVPDQVLTAHDLNELFTYLDEQERLTRTNLSGIGIVCGLLVKTNAASTEITITKGCGVTSLGYLATLPQEAQKVKGVQQPLPAADTVYSKYTEYANQLLDETYDLFVKDGNPKTKKFDLWELMQKGSDKGTDLTPGFLADKVIVAFVELLQVGNKNCDPESCDDKGKHYEVTIRPLLIKKADAVNLPVVDKGIKTKALLLPEMKMRRFDVPATALLDTEAIVAAYLKILDGTFIKKISESLNKAYQNLVPVLEDNGTPDASVKTLFDSLPNTYKFLYGNNTQIIENSVLNIQYYYDFFSDLISAYDELREKSFSAICECCPDETLFPRHIMLGEAIGFDESTSAYRQRFTPSPILCCCDEDAASVKLLFRKIVLMIKNFSVPNVIELVEKKLQYYTRITPSVLSKEFLSQKSIPFYYKVNAGSDPLYLNWNAERSREGTANQILSYHAHSYNSVDEFVYLPLHFDLEPYNFLRIEGHIGKNYVKALQEIDHIKETQRVPFDTIALSSGFKNIVSVLVALQSLDKDTLADAFAEVQKHACCFSDIFLLLDDLFARIACCLLDQMKYYMALPSSDTGMAAPASNKPVNKIFYKYDPKFEVQPNTIGQSYQLKSEAKIIDNQYCSNVFMDIATGKAQAGSALVIVPYKADRLSDAIPDNIGDLDMNEFEKRYNDLLDSSAQMQKLVSSNAFATVFSSDIRELLKSRLNFSCIRCLYAELKLILNELLLRLLKLFIRQRLAFYAKVNPGIQHKAGVTMGGTFVLVYHEEVDEKFNKEELKKTVLKLVQASKIHSNQNTGNQPMLSTFLAEEELNFLIDSFNVEKKSDKKLAKAIDGISDGIVVADFYLPYTCCSDCAPVAYIFPQTTGPAELKATASQPKCDATGQNFQVQITISGGTAPYKVDGVEIQANTQDVTIANGQGKTVAVEDSNGQKVNVVVDAHTCPQPLGASAGAPVCDATGQTFTVDVTITGGTPPYTVDGVAIAGNTRSVVVQSGQSKSVAVKDSAAQSTNVSIQAHTCPKPLKVIVGAPQCDAQGQNFSALLNISDGTPPYSVDGAAIAGNTNSVVVPSGQSKTVVVKDSAGQSTNATVQAHTCPKPLKVIVGAPVCDAAGQNFSVLLTISEGTPPYKVENNPIAGNTQTVIVANGKSQSVAVQDSGGQSATANISAFNCPQPCNLPCNGESERCEYPLWFYLTQGVEDKVVFKTKLANLVLTPEAGGPVTIPVVKIFNDILDSTTVTAANFDEVFNKLINELNKPVPSQFIEGQPMFSYDKANRLLVIEKFTCHTVVLDVSLTYNDREVHVTYNNDFVTIIDPQGQTQVPKFGCINMNKCKKTSEEVCKKPIKITDVTVKGNQQQLFTFATKPATFSSYFWYFYNGIPQTSADKGPANIQIRTAMAFVRVIGITKDGCFDIFEKQIPIG